MEAAAREFKSARRRSVCGVLHGPVRRPIAGHSGDVRQPRLSQRCGDGLPSADPVAADARRRPRRRDVRQGTAGDDDGACREPRPSLRARSWRRHAPPDRGRRRRTRADDRRALRARRALARRSIRARVPRLRLTRWRLPVPGHGGDVAGGRRSARHVARPLRARAVRSSHLARHGATVGPRTDGARASRDSR